MKKTLEIELTREELLNAVSLYCKINGVRHNKVNSCSSNITNIERCTFWLDIDSLPEEITVKAQ